MLLPHAVQIGVVMYIYKGYKGGGRTVKGRARDKITFDVTHIICHIHFKLTRLTVQARDDTTIDAQLAVYKPNNFNLWKNSGMQHYVRTVRSNFGVSLV